MLAYKNRIVMGVIIFAVALCFLGASLVTAQEDFRTIDDILGDSFEVISFKDYEKKTGSGRCIVLFYNNEGLGTSTERLALVFRQIVPEFKERILFFKFENDSDPKLARNGYIGLRREYGIKGIPYLFFYKDGKKIFEVDGGPKAGEEHFWIEGIPKDIERLLLSQ